jgi:hypothetical protein
MDEHGWEIETLILEGADDDLIQNDYSSSRSAHVKT